MANTAGQSGTYTLRQSASFTPLGGEDIHPTTVSYIPRITTRGGAYGNLQQSAARNSDTEGHTYHLSVSAQSFSHREEKTHTLPQRCDQATFSRFRNAEYIPPRPTHRHVSFTQQLQAGKRGTHNLALSAHRTTPRHGGQLTAYSESARNTPQSRESTYRLQ